MSTFFSRPPSPPPTTAKLSSFLSLDDRSQYPRQPSSLCVYTKATLTGVTGSSKEEEEEALVCVAVELMKRLRKVDAGGVILKETHSTLQIAKVSLQLQSTLLHRCPIILR